MPAVSHQRLLPLKRKSGKVCGQLKAKMILILEAEKRLLIFH